MSEPKLIAVDWGTSSFRLWVLDEAGTVLAESRGHDGMLFAAREGFQNVLLRHLKASKAPAELPILICGMAGARGGWVEAGYVETPAALTDIAAKATPVTGLKRDIRILPGLCQRSADQPDVMRGEETQLLGAAAALSGDALVCMPGTHSKWVSIESGRVVHFATYMTGDLFEAISHHTILAAPDKTVADGPESRAFIAAARQAVANPGRLTSQLFGARSGQILNGLSASASLAHISGSLIGAEIGGAISAGAPGTIRLVASGRMRALYEAALTAAGLAFETIDADEAVRNGLRVAAGQIWPH